ncbi:hypothetical protein PR048_030511 [Dryococelus australis]|uniref:Uncharacterized protein n=1 Tax=Dryococelus australis TaxID=614101 RepID=A0ABQ9G969_9NEOP|nr:hypothetical protein PR048_030511 [Dryococelus australis]
MKINIFLANLCNLPEVRQTFEKDCKPHWKCQRISAWEEHSARTINFEEQYYTVMATAESLSSVKAVVEVDSVSSRSSKVVLPKIDFPQFDGNLRCWVSYCNLCTTLVINHPDLSAISLNGAHLSLTQVLPISEINFRITWDTLVSWYYNKCLIVALHVDSLLETPSVCVN